MSKQKLELTWIGTEKRPKLEPRILLEDPEKSYHAKHRVTNEDIFDNRLIPDFVVELDSMILMVETKARADMGTPGVIAKFGAASRWCQLASEYAKSVGSKPWRYLLIGHDEIDESKRLIDYLRFEVKA